MKNFIQILLKINDNPNPNKEKTEAPQKATIPFKRTLQLCRSAAQQSHVGSFLFGISTNKSIAGTCEIFLRISFPFIPFVVQIRKMK